MAKSRIRQQETLSFLFTYLLVEHSREINLDKISLFKLTRLAQDAANRINEEDGLIPHEIIELVAAEFAEDE